MTNHYRVDRDAAGIPWPPGPWDSEPDAEVWTDVATGVSCCALRSDLGSWCGYVGVSRDHVLFGMPMDDVNAVLAAGGVSVHGGICGTGHLDTASLVPLEADYWWIGFDCMHAMDIVPAHAAVLRQTDNTASDRHGRTYKTLAFVKIEIGRLASEVAKLPIVVLKEPASKN